MFYAVKNLTVQSVEPCNPWEFVPTETITDKIRGDKDARQEWYQTQTTNHQFYSCFEGVNSNQRISNDNPVYRQHSFSADYDHQISDERVDEVIATMKLKPTWVERSLGGGVRLVWLFESPVLFNDNGLATLFQTDLNKLLKLGALPGLDESTLKSPSRVLCNGGVWRKIPEAKPIPSDVLQAVLVAIAKKYHFKTEVRAHAIPLNVVETRIKEVYPHFSWPGEFVPGSQGPSFWIPESTSPMSAILKDDGMFTFSAHATRPFYHWHDILGKDWCHSYEQTAIATATKDIYLIRNEYWRKVSGALNRYAPCPERQLERYMVNTCGLSNSAPKGGGLSQVGQCLAFIEEQQRADGAAPVLFSDSVLYPWQGKVIFNTHTHLKVVQPSVEKGVWGPDGNFPYISEIVDNLFDPKSQIEFVLAWIRHFYTSAYRRRPTQGQALFLAGCAGCGKTFFAWIIGKLMGGSVDAGSWLTDKDNFGAEIFEAAVMTSDDTVMKGATYRSVFHACLKKVVANISHRYHKKYGIPIDIPWYGRPIVTINLDPTSADALPLLDNSARDKVSLFRCVSKDEDIKTKFLAPDIGQAKIEAELPYFANWLLNTVTRPELISPHERYGVVAHHETSLLEIAEHQNLGTTSSELIEDTLTEWFNTHPEAKYWDGTASNLLSEMGNNAQRKSQADRLTAKTLSRDLENLIRMKRYDATMGLTPQKNRTWKIKRFVQCTGSTEDPNNQHGDFSQR